MIQFKTDGALNKEPESLGNCPRQGTGLCPVFCWGQFQIGGGQRLALLLVKMFLLSLLFDAVSHLTASSGVFWRLTVSNGVSQRLTASQVVSRRLMVSHGVLRHLTASYGVSRRLMVSHGVSRRLTACHGVSRRLTESPGVLRR